MQKLEDIREEKQKQPTPSEIRLYFGEAYMFCSDCGAKLYSFDGSSDSAIKCPYGGKC